MPVKYFLLVALMTPSLYVSAQDTTYYNENGDEIPSSANASTYSILYYNNSPQNGVTIKTYSKSGKLEALKEFYDSHAIRLFREFYENGELHIDAAFDSLGRLNGVLKTFWRNGLPKRLDIYRDGDLVKGTCFNKEGKSITHFPFWQMPEFPGGDTALRRFLREKIEYPAISRNEHIQGKVIVQFIVDTNGNITNININKSVSKELDAEAIKVVKEIPRWIPGKMDGEKMGMEYYLPFNFSLTNTYQH